MPYTAWRCLFITSSYSRMCLRAAKFCASTAFCAAAMRLVISFDLDRHVFFHAQPQHQVLHALAAEDAHQIVLQRKIEARAAGIALPAGASAQLIVDAPRFVPLGAEDMQAAQRDHFVVLLARSRP